MKWFWGGVWALTLTLVGNLAVEFGKEPIRDLLNDQRVTASIYAGPWYPVGGAVKREIIAGDTVRAEDRSGQAIYLQPNDDTFGRVTVRNGTYSPATDVTVDLRSLGTVEVVLPNEGSGPDLALKDVQFFKVPSLPARTERSFYIWTGRNLSGSGILDEVRVFSPSHGRIPLTQYRHAREDWEGGIWGWLEEWGDQIMFAGIVALAGMFLVGFGLWGDYAAKLLKDVDFYAVEKERYDADRRKFKPRF